MAAQSSAGPEMMLLDTSPAASVERSCATLAGRANTALNVSGFAHEPNTVIESVQSSVRNSHKWEIMGKIDMLLYLSGNALVNNSFG